MHAATTPPRTPAEASPGLAPAPGGGARAAPDADLRTRLEHYLSAQAGEPVSITSLRRLSAGLSWTTFDLTTTMRPTVAPSHLILKLGPTRGLMAPYSALPQAWAAQTFAGTDVPVPAVRWHDDDGSILGGPFLLCDKAGGEALNPFVPGYEASAGTDLHALGLAFAAALAHIHTLDWRAQPIAAMHGTHPHNSAALQEIAFWRERAQRWTLRPLPMMDLAGAWLLRHCPPNASPCVVHGDYRVGNFLCTADTITAVLDWEMVHIGDHHEDIAWACIPEFGLPGLVSHQRFQQHYLACGGRPLDEAALHFYKVFCLYKLAVINMGAAWTVEQGANDLRLACLGLTVAGYLGRLGRAIARHPQPRRQAC